MPWHHKLHRGGVLGAKLLADLGGTDSALANLPQDLTINSQTVAPTFRYEARNATTGLWTATVGENLTGAGSGGLTGLDTPLPNTADKAVNGDATRYWEAPTGATGDVGTEDCVFEFVFEFDATAGARLLAKGVGGNFYDFFVSGSALLFRHNNNITNFDVATGALVDRCWYHALFFFDRSGSGAWYLNGGLSGSPQVGSSHAATWTNAAKMRLCDSFVGGQPWARRLAYSALYLRDAWLDTHLQAAIAEERFAYAVAAFSPQLGTGPVQANLRNSVATLEKQGASGGQKLFTVGPRWPRLETRPDKHLRYASGFNCEGQHTNLLPYSQDFDNAGWFKARSTVVANSELAPDGTVTADTLAEDGTAANTHYVSESVLGTAIADHTFSCYVKPASRTWVLMYVTSAVTGTIGQYFDVVSGVLGTAEGTAPDAATIRYMGNGWYLCTMTYNADLGGGMICYIAPAEGDGDFVFDGLSQDSLYLWGAQLTETAYPVSYIKTSGSTVTRLADSLTYSGLSLPAKGTLVCDALAVAPDSATHYNATISDGGLSSERVLNAAVSTSGAARTYTLSGGVVGIVTGSAGIRDYVWRESRSWLDANDVRHYVDGVSVGTPDTSATIPPGLDRIDIGADQAGAQQANGLVRARLYSKPTTKDVTDFGAIMARAFGYIPTPAGVSTSTTYVNVGGTWASVNLTDFTLSAAGVFTYTGADTKRFEIVGSISGAKSGGGTAEITTAIEKNGTAVTASEITRDVTGSASGVWVVLADVELANGDTINFACKLDSGTETITINKLPVVIFEGA